MRAFLTIFAKHSTLNLWEGSEYVSGFKYVRVLNVPGWSICQRYAQLTYFRKYYRVLSMHRDAIIEGFWILQDFEYARELHMQVSQKVLNKHNCEWIMLGWTVLTMAGFWICLVKVSSGFEYVSCSKCRARNKARFWICEVYTGCWMCLNKPKYTFKITQYPLIMLSMLHCTWIYLNKKFWICQNSEYV